jgi:hypothetical protein
MAVTWLCEMYSGICFTTEKKARINLSCGSRKGVISIKFYNVSLEQIALIFML